MKPSLLSVAVLSVLLAACGGDSGGGSNNSPTDNGNNNGGGNNGGGNNGGGSAGGGSKPTKPFSLCHDSNLDALCTNEASQQEFDDLAAAQAASVDAGSGPVIIRGTDGTLLTAYSEDNQASVASTIYNNELFFNPEASDDDDVDAYLTKVMGVAPEDLTDAQKADFIASVAAAVKAFPNDNAYRVIGAVMDKAITQKSFASAMPTAEEVAAQAVVSFEVEDADAVVTHTKASWETSDHDERVRAIQVNNGKVLIVNRWHNTVAMADADATDQALTAQSFAAISTAGHHINSTDVDYISGASEHTLTQAWLDDNGDTLYALVPGPSSTVEDDDTWGLFRVPLENGQLPEHQITVGSGEEAQTYSVPHRHASVTRVDNRHLEIALALPDGRVLAYDSDANYVRVYNADLSEDTSAAFPLDNALIDWSISNAQQGLTLVVAPASSEAGAQIQYRALSDLKTVAATRELAVADATLSVGENASWVSLVYGQTVEQIDASSVATMATLALTGTPSTSLLASSADGVYLALSMNGGITVVGLGEAFPVILGQLEYDGRRLRALAFNGDDEILYSDAGGTLKAIDLDSFDMVKGDVDTLVQAALNSVDEDTINHGYDLDAVIYPLNMPSQFGSATLNWQVSDSLASNVVIGGDQHGQITQPAKGSEAVSGSLNVAASYSFRGENWDSDRTAFDISIRPQSDTLNHQVTPLTGDLATRDFGFVAANADGSKVALSANGSEEANAGILMATHSGGTVTPGNLVELPAAYATSTIQGLAWAGDTVRVAIESDANGKGHILSYNSVNGWSDLTLSGPIKRRGFGVSQNGAAVSVSIAPEGSDTVVFETFNNSDLSAIASVATDVGADIRYLPCTPSNDGLSVFGYVRDGSPRIRRLTRFDAETNNAVDGSTVITSATFGLDFDNASETLYGITFGADINIVQQAKGVGDFTAVSSYDTARGSYNGTPSHDHHAGRPYYTAVAGGQLVAWSNERGVMGIDISNPQQPVENFWAPSMDVVSGDISLDGKVIFSNLNNHDTGVSQIGVIILD